MQFLLDEQMKNWLLEYLSNRPWREVEVAMHALQQISQVPPESTQQAKTSMPKAITAQKPAT